MSIFFNEFSFDFILKLRLLNLAYLYFQILSPAFITCFNCARF